MGIGFLRENRDYVPGLPKDDVEDRVFEPLSSDNVKFTDYMKDKSFKMQDLYSQLYERAKKEIPELIE